jgi:hypothetical protein
MRLLHLIFRHPELKLIALGLAVLLWFHVATNQAYDINVNYSLHYVNLPDSLVIAAPPPVRALVRMHGTGKTLLRLLLQERRWPIDLSRAVAGPITVRLHPEFVPRYGMAGLEVGELAGPADLPLLLDSLGQRTVPIIAAAVIQTIPGFVLVGSPILTPDSVRLTGPRAALVGIDHVRTRSITYGNVKQTQRLALDLVRPPGYEVTMDPKQTYIYQKVEPYLRREITSLSVQIVSATDELSRAVPDRVTVELGGPQSAMTSVTPESVSVRLTVAPDDAVGARLPLTVRVHPPLEVLRVVPDSVILQRP